MEVKALEIRDRHTFIAALAVSLAPNNSAQYYLVRRCGYAIDGRNNIILTRLDGNGTATNDPNAWGGRTWPVAHNYLIDHWDELKDGDVVDVEFILKETLAPKRSERFGMEDT